MDFIIALVLFSFCLFFCTLQNISIIIALLMGLMGFTVVALKRGFALREIAKMAWKGIKKSFIVIQVFILIGLITALWRAAGTIPFFVYYGIKIITPPLFIFFAFVLSAAISFMLGSAFGTTGTIGIVLIVLAQSGGVNLAITAGAIISGAFFGDRGAPTSSSANLVAALTGSNIYGNVKNMMRSAIVPLLMSLSFYLFLSLRNPLTLSDYSMLDEIENMFNLSFFAVLPAIIIFAMILMRQNVKSSMFLSVVAAFFVCLFVQNIPLTDILRLMVFGFRPSSDGAFAAIIGGGGLLSMLSVSINVMLASSFSGIFDGTGMLDSFQEALEKLMCKATVFPSMFVIGILTSVFCCNQTFAVIIAHQLTHKSYEKRHIAPADFALHLENTVILLVALIPWNIAMAVPLATLGAPISSMAFAFYIYLVPLWSLLRSFYKSSHKKDTLPQA